MSLDERGFEVAGVTIFFNLEAYEGVISISFGLKYLRQNFRTLWKFTLIGCATMAIQILLQGVEIAHGMDIYWWSFFQGSVLANLGMAANKKWTFRDRSLPWLWAIFYWNSQKIPHTLASMVLFAAMLQIPSLPYWGATMATAGALGLGSFATTNMLVNRTATFDRWLATALVTITVTIAPFRQPQPSRRKVVTA